MDVDDSLFAVLGASLVDVVLLELALLFVVLVVSDVSLPDGSELVDVPLPLVESVVALEGRGVSLLLPTATSGLNVEESIAKSSTARGVPNPGPPSERSSCWYRRACPADVATSRSTSLR